MSILNSVLNWWYGLGGKFPETIRWDSVSGQGSSGKTVQEWQTVLGVTADGSFGPQTDAATRAWQGAHGIDPDGIVGPLTWTAAIKSLGTADKPPSTGGIPPGTQRLPQSVANSPAITAFAIEVLNDRSVPMGGTVSRNVDGTQVMVRIEPHTWTHRNGVLVTNLNPPIRGATLYQITDPAQFAGDPDPVVWRVSEHGTDGIYTLSEHGGEYSIQRDPGGHMMETGSEAEVGCSDFRKSGYTIKH